MKRTAAVCVLILLLVFSAGCGDADGMQTGGENAEPSESAEESYAANGEAESASPKPSEPAGASLEGEDMEGNQSEREDNSTVTLTVNDKSFNVVLEDNDAAVEFAQMFENEPLTLELSDYGGFEKVGSLGRELTADNTNMTTQPGDIVLYNGSNIVIFYGSNTWDYTKIGSVENNGGLREALGDEDVAVVFE